MSKSAKRIKDYRKSALSEFSAVSVTTAVIMIVIIIACIGIYIAMNIRPDKNCYVIDDADLFSADELSDIRKAARQLSDEKDINVVIITTDDKGPGYDSGTDEDYTDFARDVYRDRCISNSFRDNSGILILIDVTNYERYNDRFFWIYTYGTSYFTITDAECNRIFGRYKSDLTACRYGRTVLNILDDMDGYNWHSGGVIFTYVISLVIPLAAAAVVTHFMFRKNKLDQRPDTSNYRTDFVDLGSADKFLNRTVTVTYSSSGSGGGGGGGGGGHSGGGGGHF